tara:strand:+ start:78 stop:272 length:195 start_codon:yes stop_codon:yes gene_type:complete
LSLVEVVVEEDLPHLVLEVVVGDHQHRQSLLETLLLAMLVVEVLVEHLIHMVVMVEIHKYQVLV